SINVSSSTDEITFNIQCLKKNLDKTLDLLQERLFNPNFTDAAFKRNQKQILESFKVMKSQPATVASDVIAKINYGPNNILGMSEDGTENSVRNISLQDIQNYYKNYITTEGMKVVIVGDVKQAEILPKMTFLD